MDLLDRINKTAFLGKEFLTWLWFRSEVQEGLFRDIPDHELFEVWFDDKIVLDTALDRIRETSAIRSESPGETLEANSSLRTGKKVAEAKIRIIQADREWSCTIKGESLALSGVKLPSVLSREADEQVLERLMLIGELESMLDALFARFVSIRLDADRWEIELDNIRRWVHAERDGGDVAYRDAPEPAVPSGTTVKSSQPGESVGWGDPNTGTAAARRAREQIDETAQEIDARGKPKGRERALALIDSHQGATLEFLGLGRCDQECVLDALGDALDKGASVDESRLLLFLRLVGSDVPTAELEAAGPAGARIADALRTHRIQKAAAS